MAVKKAVYLVFVEVFEWAGRMVVWMDATLPD
jgi:hypothetical protein